MIALAEDATAAAVLDAVPCYPSPPHGRSPAIEALRSSRVGRGLVVGGDGVLLVVRRPWLAVDVPITPPLDAEIPYGRTGGSRADLRCGLVPAKHLELILDHLQAALPNEAAAFVLWNEATGAFAVDLPTIEQATPSRVVYRPPVLAPGWHLVCDIHSHGSGPAFFSATDDADDAHATKIALVFGRLGHPDGPTMASRLCVDGLFLPLPRSPSMEVPMSHDTQRRHYLPAGLNHRAIRVLLVGCGGNGGQMLMGLAALDTALRAISSRSLCVTVVDDDVVSEANLGRQPFYRCDIGEPKARTLTERINIAHGLDWTAVHGRAPDGVGIANVDLLVSRVDTASTRRRLGDAITHAGHAPAYWLDLGNRASDGQFIIGSPAHGPSAESTRLPTVLEAFPELADESVADDDAPSCSVAEALERQSLFVNRVVASHALALLFDLLGRGSIGHAGGFVNLASGQVAPIPLPRGRLRRRGEGDGGTAADGALP